MLDEDVLAAKLEQTAEVSALLRTLFTDDDEPTLALAAQPVAHDLSPATTGHGAATVAAIPAGEVIAGLDAATSALLRELASRDTWTRVEFDDLAAKYGVMPDGAIDMLNEAAIEATGEPVLEGDDGLDINPEGLEGLLA